MTRGNFLKIVIYICYSLNQLFILCWNGNKLIENVTTFSSLCQTTKVKIQNRIFNNFLFFSEHKNWIKIIWVQLGRCWNKYWENNHKDTDWCEFCEKFNVCNSTFTETDKNYSYEILSSLVTKFYDGLCLDLYLY